MTNDPRNGLPVGSPERALTVRTKAALARRGIAPQHLDPYDDPDRGWVNPMEDREVQVELKALVRRLWNNPTDPYAEEER